MENTTAVPEKIKIEKHMIQQTIKGSKVNENSRKMATNIVLNQLAT